MAGERTIERKGEQVRERVAAIKKIEGNPLDPSAAAACARAGRRRSSLSIIPTGCAAHAAHRRARRQRSSRQFPGRRPSASASERLPRRAAADPAPNRRPQRRRRPARVRWRLERFAQALGAPAPVACSLADLPVERKAAREGLRLERACRFTIWHTRIMRLGVGADFLGGWASPVYYAASSGRSGRAGATVRGRLVQAESRLSITAARPTAGCRCGPARRPQFLAAVGRMLLETGLARNARQLPQAASPARSKPPMPHAAGDAAVYDEKTCPRNASRNWANRRRRW